MVPVIFVKSASALAGAASMAPAAATAAARPSLRRTDIGTSPLDAVDALDTRQG
ncbi:hypothetical protein AB0L44_14690 [Nonomuraea wenchangensis]|uniref:hypothetical protein n=1 Tax=Nonomuraea wenchangensis TaxID=568860 RepID=UPI003448711A